ncbi:small vasohibin-binding protein [Malurus melanocephalus]|uniref:small vasohibin-binding protein n=1 Tax=Malurus melanocephalus TaxID=175006 RepID=UPI0025497958|nr:small vasohibin-binding protein [Malurus melanocephalus]
MGALGGTFSALPPGGAAPRAPRVPLCLQTARVRPGQAIEHRAVGGAPPPSCPRRSPAAMDPGAGARKERPKPREPAARLEKAKQRSAQQELKQRQRAEIYALNRVMTELEQQQFDSFCKQMQGSGE